MRRKRNWILEPSQLAARSSIFPATCRIERSEGTSFTPSKNIKNMKMLSSAQYHMMLEKLMNKP
ncbi:MAG: hypothetical protein V3S64_08255, partial [bacterium]